MTASFDLTRFIDAQAHVYDTALRELRAGRKQSHWMWFVFPQIAGLGSSPMAQRYALTSLDEARAYLDRPVLGPRLRECCQILLALDETDAERIFGYPDVMKLRSSMTLFAKASASPNLFEDVLLKFYDGKEDGETLARL
ncbi:DUF1810 domain-containing protein [Ciceribacter sp. L1K23]|uniref:DUF1810 domain-containing protein n=1 Tax=Ciceribacter sp. L1K23 TaxID=2820276 RepID=UPI001B812BD7|nr:DUF1810 domain-containing protein [Ciceribacter sp. L1K23]MBR0555299.1 DUF1810 domain-containing protein [Ciceribacter sp. L1K23]